MHLSLKLLYLRFGLSGRILPVQHHSLLVLLYGLLYQAIVLSCFITKGLGTWPKLKDVIISCLFILSS